MPEPLQQVSVVVCYHTGDLVDRCLKSIRDSDTTGLKVRTIVVSSVDRMFPNCYTYVSTAGPAEKRNLGVKQFGIGSYYIFLDDDVELEPDCLRELVSFMQANPKCAMSYAKIRKMDDRVTLDDCGSWLTWTGFLWARAQNGVKDVGQYDVPCKILASKSATCIVRADAFHAVWGFDPEYYILGEETDASWRLWLGGWEVWYNPKAVSYHAFDTPLKPKAKYYSLDRIHYRGARNYLCLLMTNLGTATLFGVLPIHLTAWIVSAVGFLVRGSWARSWLILTAIFSFLKPTTVRWVLSKRRLVQRTRKITDKKLLKMVSYSPPFNYFMKRLLRYQQQQLHG